MQHAMLHICWHLQKVETGTDLKITGYEDIQVKDGVAYGNAPLEFSADNINDYKF